MIGLRLLSALALMIPQLGMAVIYYVSPTGNDSNNGTSQSTPWRTITRAQQVMASLQPGDQVLFQRGGVYPGELQIYSSGNAANPLVFGAYGSGEQPIISGGIPITGWVQHQGNIWRANIASAPKYILVNNEPMTLARFPNTGWLRNQQGSSTQINAGSSLAQTSGYWAGATAVIRSTNWCFEAVQVTGSGNNAITFQPITANMGTNDWGFYLCNKLSELDMPGEWFYDATNGRVYLWAPNNANPNNINVLGSIHNRGIVPTWQRNHIRIENLCFQGQKGEGVYVEGANNVTVTGCTFRHLYKAIGSSGNNNTYSNNIITDSYATAIWSHDNTVLIADNVITECGLRPGLGESIWGHMGISTTGDNVVIRGNRLDNIGYIGIIANKNALIERNVVHNATSLLNDGSGIAFDHADGMIVRDNVVTDIVGDLESVATNFVNYRKICMGIYFGNTSIRNTVVERNTVARCEGTGIHVDHTMVSANNIIRDNVAFDNVIQLGLSDYSNYNGPGATPPYHVASFNGLYSGNLLYSIRPGQLCMHHYNVHSPNLVDFGTFVNNRYYSPYNELSIHIHNTNSGVRTDYTLEQWQVERGEDAGSSRSPLRQATYTTLSELSSNVVVNGDFNTNVTGWAAFPNNSQLTHSTQYLDNGAMRANLPNNSQYGSMVNRSTNQFSIQNGQWYRMRFSLQSDIHGILKTGVKGVSQFSGGLVIHERQIPFSPERRDMEIYFQAGLTDQGVIQLTNDYSDPRYWIDNIQLQRVTVQPVDPNDHHVLLINDQSTTQQFSAPAGCWSDVAGNMINGPISVPAYSSKIIYRVPSTDCVQTPTNTVGARVLLEGPLNWTTGIMRTDLREMGLLPMSEPYTALGFVVANPGVTISPGVAAVTGNDAIVDWVLVELRNNGAGHALVERRVALLQADGDVISHDGSSVVAFTNTLQGRRVAIGHRNHLAVMSANVMASNAEVVNMTQGGLALYGQDPMKVQSNRRAMWGGDVNSDGAVLYTGNNNDRDMILMSIGSVVPSNTVSGYFTEDLNLDGVVKYTGVNNDRDIILQCIGGVTPTNVRFTQAP